jgi:hypothetical protein
VLPAGAGYVGGDYVSGVAVKGNSGAVLAHSSAGVSVRSCLLYISQRHTSIQCGGDEGVAQGMRPDPLVDASAPGDPPHDAASSVAIEAPPVWANEDRPREALADGEVDRPRRAGSQGDGHYLASFAQHRQGAVPPFEAEGLDVRTNGF